jgi:peptide/nickel transport system permease protein
MSQNLDSAQATLETRPRGVEWRRFFRVFFSRGVVIFGAIILFILIVTAVAAPLLSPYDPVRQNLKETLAPPSTEHLLGTDFLGRDTMSRLIHGSRVSLAVALGAISIAAIVGVIAGMLAGFYGSWVNIVIMRCVDAFMSFPMILLALILAALLGGGLVNVMIAIGTALVPVYARLMCGQVLATREQDYILASRAIGSSNFRIMFSHILGNAFPPIIVLITMQVGTAILAEAGLSYLGIGITPPTPSWGTMVSDGFPYLITNPLLSVVPGVAIMIVVFAFNMVGDGLRDTLDPRLRGVL